MNQTIGVNITPQNFQPTLHFSQGDVGRVFVINVTDYDIPTGATVTCVATKPSGMGFTVSGTVSGNSVTFTSTAEMTDEWGRFPAEIRIASGNTLLGTANFLMIGEKDPHPASTIDGTQEELIPQLTLLVNRVEAAAESVHDLTVSATTLTAGSDATATYDSTNNSIAFGIPRGADGDVTRSEFNDLKSEITQNGVVQGSQGLVSDSKISDAVPYLFRQTADGTRVGNVVEEEIVGGTVAWNQQMHQHTGYSVQRGDLTGVTVTVDANGFISVVGTPSSDAVFVISPNKIIPANRALLMMCENYSGFSWGRSGFPFIQRDAQIIKHTAEITNAVRIALTANTAYNISGVRFMTFDLTQMFGATIADHLYNLETATAGAGVAVFRKMFPKPYYAYNAGELMSVKALRHITRGFNAWDEALEDGEINTTTGQNVGDSAYMRSKNYIPVLPNTSYYYKAPQTTLHARIFQYDANKKFISYNGTSSWLNNTFTTSSDTHYLRFMLVKEYYGNTYNNDICINISSDRNGQYEPYQKRTYALDSTLTLRGIPKLSADNVLYYDGDTYEPDGTVTRKYGIVDLGTFDWIKGTNNKFYTTAAVSPAYVAPKSTDLAHANVFCSKYQYKGGAGTSAGELETGLYYDWNNIGRFIIYDSSYADAASFITAMSGVYLVYELATPTTEEAEPYTSPQIVDRYGTEEYVTTGIVPVGHNSKYSEDLKGKIESLPWDFSTLIAPTETGKATQNYTVGSYLIMNNTLYKVTSAIANGGTITPNTNCIATTIMAEIMAL